MCNFFLQQNGSGCRKSKISNESGTSDFMFGYSPFWQFAYHVKAIVFLFHFIYFRLDNHRTSVDWTDLKSQWWIHLESNERRYFMRINEKRFIPTLWRFSVCVCVCVAMRTRWKIDISSFPSRISPVWLAHSCSPYSFCTHRVLQVTL